ncbi:MAG: DNA mismatch repair protein MutL [candidate division TA06 bacterium ADurb.Bin417]|uniref:DNA mismatch repair protein MutL n=1 Tax=candidate division TA06 bacterium ADurb.Bin417 TaxID=1852828 RepID=A0A1V5MK65_UNCT6|nr:MAG: DNA mismatch repair protein MutL [candidate division TA06 bacterium ADurb.Bin417]
MIKRLPPDLAGKIAAGEVIERPASAVKELVENGLDAGADSIEVQLLNGGKQLILVRDNGSGIDTEDLEAIGERHATSKISRLEDLAAIASFGFRGEALYSLAAVSDFRLRSRTASGESGLEVHIRGNRRMGTAPVAMNRGTEVEVRELFFNTPARRKFLKSDPAEFQLTVNQIIPYTLAYPECRFAIRHQERVRLDLAAAENPMRRFQQVLNLEPENLLEAGQESAGTGFAFKACLGDVNIQRPRRNLQFVFVNRRPVYSRAFSQAVNQAYRSVMPAGVFPFFALFLELSPELVDVNIHPSKHEVRINGEARLAGLVRVACEQALTTRGRARRIKLAVFKTGPAAESVFQPKLSESGAGYRPPLARPAAPVPAADTALPRPEAIESPPAAAEATLRELLSNAFFIGAFRRRYLIFEAGSSLLLIDQHAAHERINYERLVEALTRGKVEVQYLLTPLIIPVTISEMLVWEEGQPRFQALGFSTSRWEKGQVAIHSHPALINRPETALRNLLAEKDTPAADPETLARRACHNSIRSGEPAGREEAEALRDRLLACADPFTCPHGRPTVLELTERFLDRQFQRA